MWKKTIWKKRGIQRCLRWECAGHVCSKESGWLGQSECQGGVDRLGGWGFIGH